MNKATTRYDAANEFRTKMWRTAGARFNCHRRMKYRNTFSAFTIAILSVYLIAMTVYQKVYSISQSNPALDNHLTFISIIGAVFIIVLSLIEWASDFSVKADRLFENANKIRELRSKLENALVEGTQDSTLMQVFEEVSQRYGELTGGTHPNHDPVDDYLFRTQNRREPHPAFALSVFEAIWARIWWAIVTYWLYVTVLVMPVIFLVILAG